jgi:hypothetical protein
LRSARQIIRQITGNFFASWWLGAAQLDHTEVAGDLPVILPWRPHYR